MSIYKAKIYYSYNNERKYLGQRDFNYLWEAEELAKKSKADIEVYDAYNELIRKYFYFYLREIVYND
jgi:hypothetical protein